MIAWYEKTAQEHAQADARCNRRWGPKAGCHCGPCRAAKAAGFKPSLLNRSAIRRAREYAKVIYRDPPGIIPTKALVQMAAKVDGVKPQFRAAWVDEVFAEIKRISKK